LVLPVTYDVQHGMVRAKTALPVEAKPREGGRLDGCLVVPGEIYGRVTFMIRTPPRDHSWVVSQCEEVG